MPQVSVRAYSHPEELEAADTASKTQLTPTSRVPFAAHLVGVKFDKLWMYQVSESAARIKHTEQTASRAFFKFLTRPGSIMTQQGAALAYDGVIRHPRGDCYYERTDGETHWSSISLPVEDLSIAGAVIAGCDLKPPRNPTTAVPSLQAMANLRRLHGTIAALAQNKPSALSMPEVARRFEQGLIEVTVGCLADRVTREATWGQRCHDTIMHRFYRLIEQNPTKPMYVPEVCAAIRVPERTLRFACHEHVGIGPKQFLTLRRMTLARQALRNADATDTTVTEIAMHFGFWHISRFAVAYLANFGESPSVTLGGNATIIPPESQI